MSQNTILPEGYDGLLSVANSLETLGLYYTADWLTKEIHKLAFPKHQLKMSSAQFLSHMRSVWEKLENTIEDKDAEYGANEDTFSTLKSVAVSWKELPRNVALKLALKHYMSLLHEGNNLDDNQVRERINDIHVYLELAYCNWGAK